MKNNYPEDYNGPKAGQSTQKEWTDIRDYDAFCYITNGTWSYSDFDCYLYSMCKKHAELAEQHASARFINALEEFQKVAGFRR